MQSINTLSLTPDVNVWLANSRHPRILHIFDPACNLVNERREVLSIVTPQIGNGPFNLVVEDDVCFSDHIHHASSVSILGDELTLGDLTISPGNAELWNPQPDWDALHVKRDNITKLLITNYRECGLDTPSASASGYSTTVFNPKLPITNYQFSNLSFSLATADISSTQKMTSQLAGLGSGLTPSGDDFLLGAMYAARIIHPPEVAKVLAKAIANTAAPLTTSLSAAWLRAGARGEAGEVWHDFFKALLSVDSSAVQLQITKLLSIGHTSGADALSGFVGTMISGVEVATKNNHLISRL